MQGCPRGRPSGLLLQGCDQLLTTVFKMFLQVDSSCQTIIPKIKLEPHEVDQFLNFSPKEGLCVFWLFSRLLEVVPLSEE